MKKEKKNNVYLIIIIILLFFLSLILVAYKLGLINNVLKVKNIDIFEITCDKTCKICEKEKETVKEITISKDNTETEEVLVRDDFSIIGSKEIKIFSSNKFVAQNKIAPASTGKYNFYIKNKNSFSVVYNLVFDEINKEGINLKYKLKKNNKYIVSEWTDYKNIKDLNVYLNSQTTNKYVLEYKWIESDNDTEIGIKKNIDYKLKLNVQAQEVIK